MYLQPHEKICCLCRRSIKGQYRYSHSLESNGLCVAKCPIEGLASALELAHRTFPILSCLGNPQDQALPLVAHPLSSSKCVAISDVGIVVINFCVVNEPPSIIPTAPRIHRR